MSCGGLSCACTQNTQPPGNRLNRDSPPPPQFARHGAHTKPSRIYRNPGGTAAHPEYRYTQRCIYPLPQHQVSKRGKTVSPVVTSGCPKRSEDGFPVGTRANTVFQASSTGARGKYLYLKPKSIKFRNAKIPPIPKNQRDFLSSAPPGTRTQNPLIKSQLLCQLS